MAKKQKTNTAHRGPHHPDEDLRGKLVLSVREAAEKWGISMRRANQLCQDGRVAGAYKLTPRMWVIPADAPKPTDARTTTHRTYKKKAPAQEEELFDEG